MPTDSSLPVGLPPSGAQTAQTAALRRDDGVYAQQVIDLAVEALARLAPPRALQYARDASDRMKVVLETQPGVFLQWGNQTTYPLWFGTGAPTSMDLREEQREMTLQTFQGQRARWSFT